MQAVLRLRHWQRLLSDCARPVRHRPTLPLPTLPPPKAPHLSAEELDGIFRLRNEGRSPADIHAWLAARRGRCGFFAPNITNIRKVLKGETNRRGKVETRGRKRKLSQRIVMKLDAARRQLIQRVSNEGEVHWKTVLRRARVHVHPTTAARAFKAAGIDAKWRRPPHTPHAL